MSTSFKNSGIIILNVGVKLNIYLDMNIYYRPFDDQTQPKIELEAKAIEIIFRLIERWQYKILWSYMLEFENSSKPLKESSEDIKIVAEIICSNIIIWNESIDKLAVELVAKTNAKSKDALHLVSAIYGKCEYFITCDNRFIRTIQHNELALKHLLGSIVYKLYPLGV